MGYLSKKQYNRDIDNKCQQLSAIHYKDNGADIIDPAKMKFKARKQVVEEREAIYGDIDAIKQANNLRARSLKEMDPQNQRDRDRDRIHRNKTLSKQEKQLQFQPLNN